MATMTLEQSDATARERALDAGASFVVQAPAGSGKTELLMQRFLGLLALVERPEQMLALTFTKKAAAEMHSRITGAMRRAAEGHEPEKPHERRTVELAGRALGRDRQMGWGLLENPGRLKVQTIDSFCLALSRQMPLLSGLGRCALADKPDEYYQEAAERTIALVEEDGQEGEAVRAALEHMDNSASGLADRLTMMLARRDQWLRHVTRGSTDDELRELVEGSVARLVEDGLGRAAAAFPHSEVGRLAATARHAAWHLRGTDKPAARLADITGLPPCGAEALELWKGVAGLLLTDKGELRKPGGVKVNCGFPKGEGVEDEMKQDFKELLASLAGNEAMVEALANVRLLPRPEFSPEQWQVLLALMRLLPVAERKLAEVFADSGVVDFQAVSLSALRALGTDDEPTDLMLSLDLRLQHILVDEYQDTSHTQLALLKALTRGWTEGDGRTLFVVGDPMQSIYLFREAEVGLFLQARASGIGAVALEPLTLSRNFRSHAGMVDWVNGALGRTFPEGEDVFTGSVTYSPSVAATGAAAGRGVEVTLLSGRDDGQEAERVLSILGRIPAGETAAILCRSRAHVAAIVGALKRQAIPFRAEDIYPLSERPVVQDLLALLKALDHPLDRVAWLACLRAPFCGLTLKDLHSLCTGDKASPVRALLSDDARLSALSEDGRARAERFAAWMATALGEWGRRPPSELLRGLWTALGGPACAPADAMCDAEALLGLVESIEEAGRVCVAELEAAVEKLYSGGGSQEAFLEVMSMHRAKGLEFDNVIIPGLGKKPRAGDRELLVWMENGQDLLLAPLDRKGGKEEGIYGFLRSISVKKAEYERARLLYVAATRARRSLYLIGHLEGRNEQDRRPNSASFLRMIEHAIDSSAAVEARADSGPAASAASARRSRLPLAWELPEPAPAVLVDSSRMPAPSKVEPEFYWAGEAARYLGTVVHRYLCRIGREGPGAWDDKRIAGEQERLGAMLRSLGLGRKESASVAGEGVATLRRALRDKKGAWILSERDGAATELPLTAVIGGEIVHVVIDRTFVEDGERWVIDYKTGAHQGGSLDEFLSSEKDRYRAQLERYAEVLKAGGEQRRIRKGLYYPAHAAWVEVE